MRTSDLQALYDVRTHYRTRLGHDLSTAIILSVALMVLAEGVQSGRHIPLHPDARVTRVRYIRLLSTSPSAGADQIRPAPSVSSVGVRRPSVHLIKIEVVSLEPPQARFAGRHEMLARCSDIVWAEVRPVRELMAITALSRRPTSAARASEIRGRSARSKSR
jgi:hypothetical protein